MTHKGTVWTPFSKVFGVFTFVILLVFLIVPATAQREIHIPPVTQREIHIPRCLPYDEMVQLLGEKFGEIFVQRRDTGSAVYELFSNPGRTWSMLQIGSGERKITCIVDSGLSLKPARAPRPRPGKIA